MPIILEKGQKIDLTKGQPKVAKLQVGLGWDPIGQSGGFLSSLFGSKPNVDCDASVVMLEGDRFLNKNDLVTSEINFLLVVVLFIQEII